MIDRGSTEGPKGDKPTERYNSNETDHIWPNEKKITLVAKLSNKEKKNNFH